MGDRRYRVEHAWGEPTEDATPRRLISITVGSTEEAMTLLMSVDIPWSPGPRAQVARHRRAAVHGELQARVL